MNLTYVEFLYEVVRRERESQLRHFEGVDSKAGIVLGFAGVLILLGDSSSGLAIAGRILGIATALLALWAFTPRNYPVLDLQRLREKYALSEEVLLAVDSLLG
ncbi:MAG: hypothetical protein ACRDH6_08705 [Actinomycetota bacterium]